MTPGFVARAISITYALLAAVNFYVFVVLTMRSSLGSPTQSHYAMFHGVLLGTILVKGVIDVSLSYSFWKLKKWGRYTAIVYSACMIIFLIASLKGFQLADLPGADTGTVYAMTHLFISCGTLLACLHRGIRNLMSG